ncbi:MAG: hypothetical protein JOY85_04320 [Acidobacteriaceae bacterium]|nr:hypothetical protein [Acidobacteriaceae bacterium]
MNQDPVQRKWKIWRKRLLGPACYGYDILVPMSPSTLKVEHHDPGGLLWWEDLAEIGLNVFGFLALIVGAGRMDPLFGGLCLLIFCFLLPFVVSRWRFKLFRRRPPSVTTSYQPTEIPEDLIARYEQAQAHFQQVLGELEAIAQAKGVPSGEAWTKTA